MDPRSDLRALPRPERVGVVRAAVAAEFRAVLLVDPAEELPTDETYFDLGVTSLQLVEIRDRLADRFGHRLDSAAFFTAPTIDELAQALTADLLAADPADRPEPAATEPGDRAVVASPDQAGSIQPGRPAADTPVERWSGDPGQQ